MEAFVSNTNVIEQTKVEHNVHSNLIKFKLAHMKKVLDKDAPTNAQIKTAMVMSKELYTAICFISNLHQENYKPMFNHLENSYLDGNSIYSKNLVHTHT